MNFQEIIGSLHPAIVHIPIGLLILYALCEFVPLRWVKQLDRWQFVKNVLLIFGTVGVLGALQSGEAAADGRVRAIISTHELFAQITTWLFVILTISQVAPTFKEVLMQKATSFPVVLRLWSGVEYIGRIIRIRVVTVIIAFCGFVALFVTGALGGAIAHGVDADPATSLITKILGLQ